MLEDGFSKGKLPDTDTVKDAEKVFLRTANKALDTVKGEKKKLKVSHEKKAQEVKDSSGMGMFAAGVGVTVLLIGSCAAGSIYYLNNRGKTKSTSRHVNSEMSDYQVQREIDTPDDISVEVKQNTSNSVDVQA